jgi:hypothetical protein
MWAASLIGSSFFQPVRSLFNACLVRVGLPAFYPGSITVCLVATQRCAAIGI